MKTISKKAEWQRRQYASFTPEQRAEYNAKASAYARAARAKLTPEQLAAKRVKDNAYRAELRSRKSPKERAATRERKRVWAAQKRGEHPEETRAYRVQWMRRYKQTPAGAVELRLRNRLRKAIARHASKEIKAASTMELVGCSREFLKGWIEAQFVDGMSWDRFAEIHIDHIKPVSKFNLLDPNEQRACFHYTNLQPLWAKDNLAKTNKIVPFKIAA